MNLITLRHRIVSLLAPSAQHRVPEIDRVEYVNPRSKDGVWGLRIVVADGEDTRTFKLTIEEEL